MPHKVSEAWSEEMRRIHLEIGSEAILGRQGCWPPEQYRGFKFHVLRSTIPGIQGQTEVAEWSDAGVWFRWGTTGDFADLAHAEYVMPITDNFFNNFCRIRTE